MEKLWMDVRYALRTLGKNPGFTAIAVLVLALGIGATTAIFSVVNAVLIRPLPYKAPARLVAASSLYHEAGAIRAFPTVSLNEVEAWRRESRSFESIGSFVFSALPVSIGEQTMFLGAVGADPELLTTLGVDLAAGRNFSGAGSTHKDPSVIISHRLWVDALHSDPAAMGRTMVIDGDLFTVTGVLPATFQFPRADASYFPEEPDILFPIANIADTWGRNFTQWLAIGRLKTGVSRAQAESELQALTARMAAQDAGIHGLSVRLSALDAETTSRVRSPLLLMLGISIVLLLIACTNIMNLLFSRATTRGREMAIRKAVGATSLRLVRQMLTESACLTVLGGILGVALAWSMLGLLVGLSSAHLPITGRVGIDPLVLGFTLVVCAGAALLAGLFPALHTSGQRENLLGGAGSRAFGGRVLGQFQRGLTVAQMALGLGLLAGAGLLAHSLLRLSSVDPGFRTAGVLGFELAVPSSHSGDAAARALATTRTMKLFQRMLEETRSIPGVLSAGWITNLPPETRSGMFLPFSIVGAAQAPKSGMSCNFQVTSEDYFQTVGVPLVRGRDFTRADAGGAPPVLIVNESFARQFFGATGTLGERVVTEFDEKDAPREIVGIIRDTHDRGLSTKSIATAYVPYEQFTQAYGAIAVRTNVPPETIFPEIRRRMTQIDPTVPVKNFTTISARVHKTLDEPRFYALIAGACGLMAVLFVTLGLYGVVSYSVARRTAEIGIRMALGAPKQSILRDVLWQGLRMAGLGVAIGLALSLTAGPVLANLLFEIKPNDPATLAMAAGVVLAVTLAASYIPARRASRVDPMVALRYE
jgi:putative ABC transport system permease protein